GTFVGRLPLLSIATWCLPLRRPVDCFGTSSTWTSLNGATSIVPSATVEPGGSSREMTRIPNGTTPAGTSGDFAGANVIATSMSAPGSRLTSLGSTVVHSVQLPTTSIVYWSTTCPVLRTSIVADVVDPGS